MDAAALVRDIRGLIARKTAEGVYRDARIARRTAQPRQPLRQRRAAALLPLLPCAAPVPHRHLRLPSRTAAAGSCGKMLVKFKTVSVAGSCSKFYTYRLWSAAEPGQRPHGHGAIDSAFQNYEKHIARLEKRIAELEKQAGPSR
ncbi:MAG: hypothetical protein U1G05_03025 [Kiritimatiellia bacterium]